MEINSPWCIKSMVDGFSGFLKHVGSFIIFSKKKVPQKSIKNSSVISELSCQTKKTYANMPRVLLVLTNHDQIGDTGKKTGWYLPEVAPPYEVFANSKCDVTFTSPKGGATPIDPSSLRDFGEEEICKRFLNNKSVMDQTQNTVPMKDVNAKHYDAIFYAGGVGPMFDMPNNPMSNKLAADVYENGGIASAVCHGPAGLVDVKLSNGEYLVNGVQLTSFTNDEEIEIDLMKAIPFALESRLREHGAITVSAKNGACNVVATGRVVTGQNPASATGTAEAIVEAWKKLKK